MLDASPALTREIRGRLGEYSKNFRPNLLLSESALFYNRHLAWNVLLTSQEGGTEASPSAAGKSVSLSSYTALKIGGSEPRLVYA